MNARALVGAAADSYPSIERGTLDAGEFVGPHDDEKLGFMRVARFYLAPGFREPGARLHQLINNRAFGALPGACKHALEAACDEADSGMLARYDHLNPPVLRRLVAAGAQLRFWPRGTMQAAWRASHGVCEETGVRNARFRRFWDAYRPHRGGHFKWFRLIENAFDNFAFPAAAAVR